MTVDEDLEKVHQFSFHRSPVTAIEFLNDNSQIASGSADTYIVVYDLIGDTAQFKLLGHNEQITKLASFAYEHATRGSQQTLLISSSKDGLLKFWDLEQQACVLNSSDQYLSKVETFAMIPELNLLVAGSSDNALKIFKLEQVGTAVQCNFKATLKKDSGARAIDMFFEKSLKQLIVLSADNKLEAIKVNVDNKESLMKKLLRQEKRKTLKRKRDEAEDDDAVPEVNIDKVELKKALDSGAYDISLHFSKKLAFDIG